MNKLLGWLAIIIIIGLSYMWQPEFFHNAYAIIEKGDIAALAEYLRSFGPASILVTIILFVVMTFTIVFPFMILSGAAGIVYGLFWGVIISWAGEVIGALVMFIFARYFFRQAVEGWIVKSRYLKQVDNYSATNGFKALLLARLLPLAPSGIITAVAAISKISFKDFLLATVLGKLPPVIIKVIIGHDIVFAGENLGRLIVVTVLVILVYSILWWRKKKQKSQA
ncbi:TVP38/TMEM64 family protein [Sporomusa sphaeroides]|uniref:TVP38/TMEM64 family membrane protein n=1 Tax=Sporomusa sphaeroides DSM 2875 TaxID=1337886 RepID=A0ABM9W400_9FIRM|nr:VTT domain-containing protein [Sporomusa sphaeroides]OLS58566.1 TVP38/TMEM64 family inner membrane protein YdjZ [Sporomusa sphaeroides DSM 2875]CVK19706.1 TVP38/TMEM64 family inner membrane protein YdjZ [Sporomusa sphaeroides DSM 2875]